MKAMDWFGGVARGLAIAILAGCGGGLGAVDAAAAKTDALAQRLTPDRLEQIFPGADRVEPTSGQPPAAAVYRGGVITGYVLSVGDLAKPRGTSGRPFDILLGLDLDATVTGAALIAHGEALYRNIGGAGALEDAIAGLVGLDVLAAKPEAWPGYAGRGEISALALLDGVYRAGRAVALANELRGPGEREGWRLDLLAYRPLDWAALRALGAARRLSLSSGDIGAIGVGQADMAFAEIFVADATPALIGRNLLGDEAHAKAVAAGGHIVLLAMSGPAALPGGALSPAGDPSATRLRLRQGGLTLPLSNPDPLASDAIVAGGAPRFARVVLARLPGESGFAGARPWMLELTLGAPGAETVFALPYAPPPELVIEPVAHLVAVADNRKAKVPPLWVSVWLDQRVKIGVLAAALLALSAILLLQGRLARRPRLLRWLRGGFLAFTLVGIGWYGGAQVSVMHLVTLARAPFNDGGLAALMLDPLTLIVMAFAGLGLLLLGRGVFCGWLCPFGALQDFLNTVARRLKVPQPRLSAMLNERLWALKYVLVISLIGLGFADAGAAARAAEIEPFNTAIMFTFKGAWPYTLLAIAVLGAGLFVERFFCRYLCPLGGGLAIVGRWRMLDWYKRRPECGHDCNICQTLCPVQAIGDDGTINLNECYQCMRCQVTYHDDRVCPPLVSRRLRRERMSGAAAATN